jgi:hypothetical protein
MFSTIVKCVLMEQISVAGKSLHFNLEVLREKFGRGTDYIK